MTGVKTLLPLCAAGVLLSGCGDRGLGVGVSLFGPTGVAVKGWLNDEASVNAAAGWPGGGTRLHADYIMHNFRAFSVDDGDLALYIGLGCGLAMWDDPARDDEIRVRVPVGLDYIFEGGRLDMFFEIVPGVIVSPAGDFDVTAALGLRFFFK